MGDTLSSQRHASDRQPATANSVHVFCACGPLGAVTAPPTLMTSRWVAREHCDDHLRHLRVRRWWRRLVLCSSTEHYRTMTLTCASDTDVGEMKLKQRGTTVTEAVPMISEETATSRDTCRCLFGPVDPADNVATAASLRASLDRLNTARWGYDFSAGRPLSGGRFEWTEIDCRRSTNVGNDVRDRAALQQVNCKKTPYSEFVTSSLRTSSPPMKRRRHAVTSSQRRQRESACFDDVIRHIVVCTPASQQHRNARFRRHIITGTNWARACICRGI